MMNAKLSRQRFWHCHKNRLIKTIQSIPHNLYVIVTLTSLYCACLSWFILIFSKGRLTWHSPIGIVWIVMMIPFSWQCQNLCLLSLAFIIDWRVVLIFSPSQSYNVRMWGLCISWHPEMKNKKHGLCSGAQKISWNSEPDFCDSQSVTRAGLFFSDFWKPPTPDYWV